MSAVAFFIGFVIGSFIIGCILLSIMMTPSSVAGLTENDVKLFNTNTFTDNNRNSMIVRVNNYAVKILGHKEIIGNLQGMSNENIYTMLSAPSKDSFARWMQVYKL